MNPVFSALSACVRAAGLEGPKPVVAILFRRWLLYGFFAASLCRKISSWTTSCLIESRHLHQFSPIGSLRLFGLLTGLSPTDAE